MEQATRYNLSDMMADFANACRNADLKLTHQRLEIYRELALAKDHPSAEMLYKRIIKKLPTISIDTVYRNLATMEKNHLITRVQTLASQARFEAKMASHHHAVCRQCGAITDFSWGFFDEVQIPAEITSWGHIIKKNAVLEGVCKSCAGKS